MRRIACWLAGVLLVVSSLGSNTPSEDDGATEMNELEGSWRMVAVEYCGRDQPVPVKGATTYCCGKFTWPLDHGGTYRADLSRKPAHLDETEERGPSKGKTWKCIYQVDGDTLRIAMTSKGDQRPENFDSKKDLFIVTYKRIK
jgi:uncharacterized protein (TIGR03067 family)